MNKEEKKGISVWVPIGVLRWLVYSLFFIICFIPGFLNADLRMVGIALVLGHISSQLNTINTKLNDKKKQQLQTEPDNEKDF